MEGTRASVAACSRSLSFGLRPWSHGVFGWPYIPVARLDVPCSSMWYIHKGETGCKALVLKKKIHWVGSLRIKNWESSCFGWSYIFAASCFQPTRWEKWACLPFVYCCNPHISVHIIQREKRDTYLYVALVKWRTGCAQLLMKLKGCAGELRAVESLPRLWRSRGRILC